MKLDFRHLLFIFAGDAIAAIGVSCFLTPSNISAGGLTGIAAIVSYLTDIPQGTVIFALNLPLILIGYFKLGKSVMLKTFLSATAYSFFVDLFADIIPSPRLDITISTFSGGVIMGAGMGVILLFGATSGGTDIAAKLLQIKFPYISTGRMLLLLDGIVVALSYFVYGSLELSLYAATGIFTATAVMDKILNADSGGKLALIVTDCPQEVKNQVFLTLSRGVSEIKITGGYTNTDKTMLVCALRRQQIGAFYSVLRKFKGHCFAVMCDAGEIIGNGF